METYTILRRSTNSNAALLDSFSIYKIIKCLQGVLPPTGAKNKISARFSPESCIRYWRPGYYPCYNFHKTVRERVRDELAARSNSGSAVSRGNRTSQGKQSLPRQGPTGPFSLSDAAFSPSEGMPQKLDRPMMQTANSERLLSQQTVSSKRF